MTPLSDFHKEQSPDLFSVKRTSIKRIQSHLIPTRPKEVLVVDDNYFNISCFIELVTSFYPNFQVSHAFSGQQALDLLGE